MAIPQRPSRVENSVSGAAVDVQHGNDLVSALAKGQSGGEFSGQAAGGQDAVFTLFERGDFFFGGAQGWISVTGIEENLGVTGGVAAQLLGVLEGEDGGLLDFGGEGRIAAMAVFSGVNGEGGVGFRRTV